MYKAEKLRNLFFSTVLLLAVVIYPGMAFADNLKLETAGAVLMDPSSGQLLWSLNPDVKWYPASTTKVMTLLLALEAVDEGRVSLKDKVVGSEHAASFGGTQVWLEPGEEFTLEELLKAIAVGSANDASVAVAEFLSGSEEEFVELMNQRAKELGAKQTHFANPHGLFDENHYTTPLDLALFAQEALKHPDMLRLTSIKEYTFREKPKLILYNTNKLLWWYPGTDGLKTGYVSQSKRNLVSTVERDGMRLLAVVMGVEKGNGHFSESMKLLNWGFANYTFKNIHEADETLAEIPVVGGREESVKLVSPKDVGAIVPKGKNVEVATRIIKKDSFLMAPVVKGQVVGELVVSWGGRDVGCFPLVTAGAVERGTVWQDMGRIWKKIFTL